jgi:hypothetical protein
MNSRRIKQEAFAKREETPGVRVQDARDQSGNDS